MLVCAACGDTNFTNIDGHYYCKQCDTQSQVAVEEELDDPAQFCTYYGVKLKRSAADCDKSIASSTDFDQGRSWQSFEAWTVILSKQADCLIQLGAHPKLKDIVLKLWMLYLRTLNVAFTQDVDQDDSVCRVNSKRDVQRVTKSGQKRKHSSVGSDPPSLCSADISSPQSPNDEPSAYKAFDVSKRKNVWRQAQWMTRSKTLMFCYLGLLHVQSTVTLPDLLGWVDDGTIPYKSFVNILPEDMKFSTHDSAMFAPSREKVTLSCSKLHVAAGTLLTFLNIQTLPAIDLYHVISHYIIRLGLPAQMHAMAHCLLSRKPSLRKLSAIHKVWDVKKKREDLNKTKALMTSEVEVIAMSVIIIILKILFRFNGKHERKISERAQELKNASDECQPFLLDEWLRFLQKQQQIGHQHGFTGNLAEVKDIVDVDSCVQNCLQIKSNNMAYQQPSNNRYTSFSDDHREDMMNPIRQLSFHLTDCLCDPQDSRREPDPFDISLSQLFSDEPYVQPPVDDTQSDVDKDAARFRQADLRYILRGDSADHSLSLFSQDLDERDGKSAEPVVYSCYSQADSTPSYHWLLTLCANHIRWSVQDLHEYVMHLELQVVRTVCDSAGEERRKCRTFRHLFLGDDLEYAKKKHRRSDKVFLDALLGKG